MPKIKTTNNFIFPMSTTQNNSIEMHPKCKTLFLSSCNHESDYVNASVKNCMLNVNCPITPITTFTVQMFKYSQRRHLEDLEGSTIGRMIGGIETGQTGQMA